MHELPRILQLHRNNSEIESLKQLRGFMSVFVRDSKQFHTVVTIPKSNIKILESVNIYTTNTQIHDD